MKLRKPPKRKSAHRHLVIEADGLVRAIVLHRQAKIYGVGVCLKCQQARVLQAAHILGKGAHNGIRFDLENVIGLCLRCHIFWCHRDPVGFVDWINELFPGRIDKLKLAASQYRKQDLKELIVVLKSIAKQEGAI